MDPDDLQEIFLAYKNSCTNLIYKNTNKAYKNVCAKAKKEKIRNSIDIIKFLSKNFSLQKITKSKRGIMTGYYEPEVKASRIYVKGFYPLYKRNTDDFSDTIFNKSRKEINTGALENKGLEIAWVESEIEAFFLHIQGSGRLKLENGEVIKVRYSGNNNKKYTSIGKYLLEEGAIRKENMSMFSIKNWLKKNKKEARKVMEINERYIFFEEYKGNVKGGSNEDLIPEKSIAVDPKFHRAGSIFLIKKNNNNKEKSLAISHDTGAAIKGKGRIDLFLGFGKEAEKIAATLHEEIELWKLLPK